MIAEAGRARNAAATGGRPLAVCGVACRIYNLAGARPVRELSLPMLN